MWLANLQLGADGGPAVVAEVQHGSGAHPQTQQHTEVIHQQHRGSPLLWVVCPLSPLTGAAQTGPDKLVQTLQANRRIPGVRDMREMEMMATITGQDWKYVETFIWRVGDKQWKHTTIKIQNPVQVQQNKNTPVERRRQWIFVCTWGSPWPDFLCRFLEESKQTATRWVPLRKPADLFPSLVQG